MLLSESMENRQIYHLNMNIWAGFDVYIRMGCITSQKYVFLSFDSRGKLYD